MRSEQWTNGETQPPVSLTTEGRLREYDGIWEIAYEESEATGMEGTMTTISLSPDGVIRLYRYGNVEMDMVFRRGQNHLSQIDMPFGTLSFQLTTSEAEGCLDENGGRIALAYALDFDRENVISTRLSLDVFLHKRGGRPLTPKSKIRPKPVPDENPKLPFDLF
jgi:uncharacterized beta-barrel protein YwiB (DUF1934 family)